MYLTLQQDFYEKLKIKKDEKILIIASKEEKTYTILSRKILTPQDIILGSTKVYVYNIVRETLVVREQTNDYYNIYVSNKYNPVKKQIKIVIDGDKSNDLVLEIYQKEQKKKVK